MMQTPSLIRRIDQTGYPLLVLRVVLAAVFIYLGTKKILDPVAFLKAVRMYQMLPEEPAIFLNLTAIVLPWLEVLAGIALILGLWVRGAGILMAGMLAVFTPAIFLRAWDMHVAQSIPFLKLEFDCGCGSGVVVIWKKLLENTALFFGALAAAFSHTRRFCLEKYLDRSRRRQLYCRICGYLLRKGGCCTPAA